jgi:hypothetical protein
MTLAWIDENVTRKNDLDRLKPIIAELNEFLDPTTAIIQDEQKENAQENPVVVDNHNGSVGVHGEQQQTSLFNNAMTNV